MCIKGWINIVEDCRFYGNAATSLHMANNINNVNVLNNLFENNGGLGIVINGGVQVLVQGNVFESLAGLVKLRAPHPRLFDTLLN